MLLHVSMEDIYLQYMILNVVTCIIEGNVQYMMLNTVICIIEGNVQFRMLIAVSCIFGGNLSTIYYVKCCYMY